MQKSVTSYKKKIKDDKEKLKKLTSQVEIIRMKKLIYTYITQVHIIHVNIVTKRTIINKTNEMIKFIKIPKTSIRKAVKVKAEVRERINSAKTQIRKGEIIKKSTEKIIYQQTMLINILLANKEFEKIEAAKKIIAAKRELITKQTTIIRTNYIVISEQAAIFKYQKTIIMKCRSVLPKLKGHKLIAFELRQNGFVAIRKNERKIRDTKVILESSQEKWKALKAKLAKATTAEIKRQIEVAIKIIYITIIRYKTVIVQSTRIITHHNNMVKMSRNPKAHLLA